MMTTAGQGKYIAVLLLLTAGLAAAFAAALALGALPLSLRDICLALLGRNSGGQAQTIVLEMRLPRALIAALVGACLAMSGALLQTVTRNGLVSPDIVGISSGASVGAVILILLFPASPPALTPLFAFCGGAVAAFLIYLLSWRQGVDPLRLVLIGIAVTAMSLALRDTVVLKAPEQFDAALSWLSGSIWGKGAERLGQLWPWALLLTLAAFFNARSINILQFHDHVSRGLGSSVEKTRLLAIAIAVGLAGCAVSIAGNIGFVGLIAPHMARLLVGHRIMRILPATALLGAILTVAADTAGRVIIAPSEIPAGILTSLLGAPYFIWLLIRHRRS